MAIGMKDAIGCNNRDLGQISRALFKVVQEEDHHMKTGFGKSVQAYGNETIPHQGSG